MHPFLSFRVDVCISHMQSCHCSSLKLNSGDNAHGCIIKDEWGKGRCSFPEVNMHLCGSKGIELEVVLATPG